MILQKMGEFFESRLDGYDAHMLNVASEIYPCTASLLPKQSGLASGRLLKSWNLENMGEYNDF